MLHRIALPVLLTLVAAPCAAQSAGAWGAEASSGPSASLLRFRSQTSAWVVSAFGQFQQQRISNDTTPDPFAPTQIIEQISSEVRIGLRRYNSAEQPLRTFSTWSGIVTYETNAAQEGWGFGVAGEMGAAHFFSSNVSLGMSADVSATRRSLKRGFDDGELTIITVRFSGFRLVGGVYF